MQHALVHLVAAVVGAPVEYTNLWYHLFSPEELKGSFVPGFNVRKSFFSKTDGIFIFVVLCIF